MEHLKTQSSKMDISKTAWRNAWKIDSMKSQFRGSVQLGCVVQEAHLAQALLN